MGDVKLCRLCAVRKDSFVDIYEEEGDRLNLENKINQCLQIELLKTDELPKSVCRDCCAKLDQFFDFCESSNQAQLTLHMIFAAPQKAEMEEVEEELEIDTELDEEYESGTSVEEEEDVEEEEEDDEEEEEENSILAALNPDPPEYVECVLSDNQANKTDAGPSMSKRKCRVPMRLAPDKAEEPLPATEPVKPMRKTKVDPAVANRAVAATSREDSSPRKRRDGWDKYPWLCTDCDEEMPSMQALRGHHSTVHNQPARFMCAECSMVYNKYYGFVSHVRRHRNHMKFCCEECGKCFSNKKVLESHRGTHSDARPYVCAECGKSFRQQSALYVHNRSHQPDDVKNKYPCDQCDKRFSTKPNLVTHKRIHTGIRNYTCDQCGKSFIQKGNLDAHLITHSHEKPHLCPICKKGFKTPLQLRKHHTVHTGAKPHQCDVCGRQFRERGTLREHHRIHTGAMPFSCEFCGKNFRFKGILTTHRRQHTGERPYSCIECQHHFTNWPNYNKHMKRRHGINTSIQPDPNKIAMAEQKALLASQAAASPPPPHPTSLYGDDQLRADDSLRDDSLRDRGQFYNAPGIVTQLGSYGPNMTSLIGYYNIPQMQGMEQTTTAIDMLQHR